MKYNTFYQQALKPIVNIVLIFEFINQRKTLINIFLLFPLISYYNMVNDLISYYMKYLSFKFYSIRILIF